jgi:hypothetical protein
MTLPGACRAEYTGEEEPGEFDYPGGSGEARKGGRGGLVKQHQFCLLILARHSLGFDVSIKWAAHPPEEHSFLEEHHVLTWWNHFMLERSNP